ncbi:MAG TPA: hypothetical protein DCR43_03130 [Bacteroidales bacterium]|nr:hypothetical protein [Bacteroidales bacterium]
MKTASRLLLLFIGWVITQPVTSQSAVIKGKIPEGSGLIVQLIAESNPFTRHLEVLATDTSDAGGGFILSVDTNIVFQAGVDVWFQTDWFWITPGDTLKVQAIQPVQPGFTGNRGSAGFTLTDITKTSTSFKITKFDMEVASFLDSNFNDILRKRDIRIARNFIHRQQKLINQSDDRFLADYMQYTLMGLAINTMVRTPTAVAEELFKRKPDYQHPAYLELLSQLFKDYHLKTPGIYPEQLINAATEKEYTRFLHLLGSDTLLKNDLYRELAAIQIITDIVYAMPPEKRLASISLLDSLALHSRFAEHRVLASKVGNQLRELLPGTLAPPLLTGSQPFTDTLNSMPLLIVFTHTQCASCLEAADWLAAFKSRENWQCNVITIFLDYDQQEARSILALKSWPWKSVWGGNDFAMMHRWQISSLPLFAIIGSDGKIIQYPTMIPGPESEKYLLKLTKSKQPVRRRP